MFSPSTIRNLQLEAAARASRENKTPLVPWDRGDLRHAPFLGDYVPQGWRKATWDDIPLKRRPRGSDWWHGPEAALFVDSSGMAGPNEPALTFGEADTYVRQLLDVDERTWGVGILQAGQFQVYLGLYVKDDAAPGTPVDESVGLCERCGEPDGELDYHECPFDDPDDDRDIPFPNDLSAADHDRLDLLG